MFDPMNVDCEGRSSGIVCEATIYAGGLQLRHDDEDDPEFWAENFFDQGVSGRDAEQNRGRGRQGEAA